MPGEYRELIIRLRQHSEAVPRWLCQVSARSGLSDRPHITLAAGARRQERPLPALVSPLRADP